MPTVSVILPTHDRRALVREAVQSVLAQSYRDFEVVMVDDGSCDGTAAALRAEFGDAVRVIETTHRGVSAARNTGAAAARGGWLAFLDSDDLWLRGKLEAQMSYLAAHPESVICQTEEIWIRDGVRVNQCRHHAKPEGDVFLANLERCLICPSSVVLRRDVFERAGGFDETLPVCEDYDLWLRLTRTMPVGCVREELVVKRGGHADQLSTRFWGMDRFRVVALRKILAQPLTAEQRRAVEANLHRKCAILAAGAEKRGQHADAAHYRELAESHA